MCVDGEEAEGFEHGIGRVVAVPDVAAVELVALGGRAEQRRILANGRGDGLRGGFHGVDIEGHDDLLMIGLQRSERCAPM